MKRNVLNVLLLSVLVLGSVFTSCKKDEETEDGFPKAPVVTASLDEDHPNWVNLNWDVIKGAFTYNIYRSESADGDFERLYGIGVDKGSCTDKSGEYNTTYYYKVVSVDINFEEGDMPAQSVEITTGGADLTGDLGAVTICDGEGDEAILQYVRLIWNVPTSEGIDEFKVMKNGNLLTTVSASYASVKEYTYDDEYVYFDTEYEYQIITIDEEGNELSGNTINFTPKRPEPIDRPVPEVVEIENKYDAQEVVVHLTQVTDSEYDLYAVKTRFKDVTDWLDYEGRPENYGRDDDGNLTVSFGYGDVNFPYAGAYFEVQVRVFTDGGWSDWSPLESTYLMVQ